MNISSRTQGITTIGLRAIAVAPKENSATRLASQVVDSVILSATEENDSRVVKYTTAAKEYIRRLPKESQMEAYRTTLQVAGAGVPGVLSTTLAQLSTEFPAKGVGYEQRATANEGLIASISKLESEPAEAFLANGILESGSKLLKDVRSSDSAISKGQWNPSGALKSLCEVQEGFLKALADPSGVVA